LLQENTHWYGETVSGGLLGGINTFAYVEGNPLSMIDPMGLMGNGPGGGYRSTPVNKGSGQAPGPAQAAGAAADFRRNYSDMRNANTIGADKYFHCKANCQASRRGSTGDATACLISDTREWFDQNVKGDPASASQADQAANTFGRSNASTSGSCDVVCGIYRPNGLPSQY
jgi:Serum amyloid A protein